jgi:hypothetical protein
MIQINRLTFIRQVAMVSAIFLVAGLFFLDEGRCQNVGDAEQALERNRDTLARMDVDAFVRTMIRIHRHKEKMVAELDDRQGNGLAELASAVLLKIPPGFHKGIGDINDPTEYRKLFGIEIEEEDLELQRRQIEHYRKCIGELESILLPHQLKLLEFAEVREAAEQRNPEFGTLGVALGLSDELKLDEKGRKLLKEATEKAVQQYRAEAAELNKKAWTEVLAVLPEEKRKMLAELVGDLATEAQFDANAK